MLCKVQRYKLTLAAFSDFSILTKSPCFVILLLRSEAESDWLVVAAEAALAGAASGFQSFPVAALYSAFKAKRTLTSASIFAYKKR